MMDDLKNRWARTTPGPVAEADEIERLPRSEMVPMMVVTA
jgi:hypothetical protein